MTDDTTPPNTNPNIVEFHLCAACGQEFAWRIAAALAEPYGGLDNENWVSEMRRAAPELLEAVDAILGPLLELKDPEHVGSEPDAEDAASAADAGARVH